MRKVVGVSIGRGGVGEGRRLGRGGHQHGTRARGGGEGSGGVAGWEWVEWCGCVSGRERGRGGMRRAGRSKEERVVVSSSSEVSLFSEIQ